MTPDLDQFLAEVSRLEPVTWHARSALAENGYTTTVIALDSAEEDGIDKADVLPGARLVASYLSGKDAEDIVLCRASAPALAAEVQRLRADVARQARDLVFLRTERAMFVDWLNLWLTFPKDPSLPHEPPDDGISDQVHDVLRRVWEKARIDKAIAVSRASALSQIGNLMKSIG